MKNNPGTKALIFSQDLPFAQKRLCGLEGLDHVEAMSLFRHPEALINHGLMIADGPLKGLSARCVMILDTHHNITYIDLVKELSDEPNYHDLFKKI